MARQITVLEQFFGDAGTRIINLVFWYPIAVQAARVPKPSFKSAAPTVTPQEQADLEAGVVREEVLSMQFPTSYNTTQLKAEINARYTDKATAVATEPAVRAFYGVLFDSVTGWSA